MNTKDTIDRRTVVGALATASLGVVLEGAVPGLAAAQGRRVSGGGTPASTGKPFAPNSAVVLVHGAWADGSCWERVIVPLEQQGLKVICAPIPMTSLSDDIAVLGNVIERTAGPVVLVGHAYSGGVIGATHHDRVKALVYISALAPAEGETVAQVFYKDQAPAERPKLAPDAQGFIWIPDGGFQRAVAHNASPDVTAVLQAVQRPIAVKCIQEKSPPTAWPATPTWYLIAEDDRMINPITQRFMAARMQAHVHSFKVDHSSEVTAPSRVIAVIMEAARATLVEGART
jgi:pimeloyl-ACP methyl ester carboxylesterase